jgi:HK97 family phage major capsid protein
MALDASPRPDPAQPMREDERVDRIKVLRERQQELDSEAVNRSFTPQEQDEFEANATELAAHEHAVDQLQRRRQYLSTQAYEQERQEGPDRDFDVPQTARPGAARGDEIWDLSTIRGNLLNPAQMGQELKSRAMQAIERSEPKFSDDAVEGSFDPDKAKGFAEKLVRNTDNDEGRFSRYMLATGSPVYKRAFAEYLRRGDTSGMTREEQTAWYAGQQAERAMSLTGSAGGFAVPFDLDPTIMLTSNGVINPVRQVARVRTITVDEWRGLTTSGVTASYAAEGAPVGDQTPTFVQPVISTEKAHAFVGFTIEIGQDFSGNLQEELADLFADARDTLEATKFISGTGTNEPFGIATGASLTVNAGASQTFTLSNLYSLKGALPPRYRPNASYLADSLIFDRVRQFDTIGSSAAVWVDSLQDGMAPRLLGRPAYEVSEMPDAPSTGAKFMYYGDIGRAYTIVDRVGLTVEYIPHVFNVSGTLPQPALPMGQRGLYCYWRNGAKVIDPNAIRGLVGVA